MDLLMRMLHREEKKLLSTQDKVAGKLTNLRAAIHALAGNGNKSVGARVSKLKGKPLSAKHRAAIRAGWAKRRKAQA
ncbi:MAG TPA: hypothetical protein VMR90_12425 [Candidatus Cybelea sp.]|nr:hypothetical protein [Candidatus Cybelea sp.]